MVSPPISVVVGIHVLLSSHIATLLPLGHLDWGSDQRRGVQGGGAGGRRKGTKI